MEKWLPVIGYEEYYKISNTGYVKAIGRFKLKGRYFQYCPEIILKPQKKKNGYFQVSLRDECRIKYVSIHRLVAIHFIPNKDSKPAINHKDGNKKNNHFTNLEWCTYKENINHADNTGLRRISGVNNKRAAFTEEQIIMIRISNLSLTQLASKHNVNKSCIYKIKNRISWKHVQ